MLEKDISFSHQPVSQTSAEEDVLGKFHLERRRVSGSCKRNNEHCPKYRRFETKNISGFKKSVSRWKWNFSTRLGPCHSLRKTTKIFIENRIQVLEWLGNSPDLHPIENLWRIIKFRLKKMDCTTIQKLVEAIIEVWYHDREIAEKCKRLVNQCQMM